MGTGLRGRLRERDYKVGENSPVRNIYEVGGTRKIYRLEWGGGKEHTDGDGPVYCQDVQIRPSLSDAIEHDLQQPSSPILP